MDESSLQLLQEIGEQFHRRARPTKDFILKSLRQVVNALAKLEQPSALDATCKLEVAEILESSIKTLKTFIVHQLLQHKDKEVRLLLAVCVSEIFRVQAPELPFEDKYLRDVFKLILSTFADLADTASPFFSWRAKVLETVQRCKCCVIMLDVDCNDLVVDMFRTFFSAVRDYHQQNLLNDVVCIMSYILYEEVSQQLLDVILDNLLKERQGESAAASLLAVSVIERCGERLEPFVCGFLTSCILNRDAVGSELKEYYHEIIFKIFQRAPQMLLAVIPNLVHELLTDQVDVRIKVVDMIGKLLTVPEGHVARNYHDLFMEFLKRFSDKSSEVRISSILCAKACFMANPSGLESQEVIKALEGRLLDFDDKVRTQAVIVACDIATSNVKFVSPLLISQVMERLRDKKVFVRRKAFQKLLEVYRAYCNQCSEGFMSICNEFEQIPCKILMLCYDKDCKEFRSQNMELILAEDLFPIHLTIQERTAHWIHLFSLFTPFHIKALSSILSLKRRFQTEMQSYLDLRLKQKENHSEDMNKRIKSLFVKMSTFFPDPIKAEECFLRLNQMKDDNIFGTLAILLSEMTIIGARATRDKILNLAGERNINLEFIKALSSKCSYNIFGAEHITSILNHISINRFGNKKLEVESIQLLQTITGTFPSLLRGSEGQFLTFLEEGTPIDDSLIEVLATTGAYTSMKLRDVYPLLKRLCLEGTRPQAKFAVSAIGALVNDHEQLIFSKLCKELVDSMRRGRNLPTVLQSIGCIAQYSVPTFESHYEEIVSYIRTTIFKENSYDETDSFDDPSLCSKSCKLKIFGLKTLVKSYLPHQGSHVSRKIDEFLDYLLKILNGGEFFVDNFSCVSDKSHIRLAAAKSVLLLSRRWDLYITPPIFCSTIFMAEESSFVRRLFIDKTHKLLKKHAIPNRYACAFALSILDCPKNLQNDSIKYMAEFIEAYSRKPPVHQTSVVQGGSLTSYPAYIVVYLIYLLAHDVRFPSIGCQDEELFARFFSPLFFVLQILVNRVRVDEKLDVLTDSALYLCSIFRAIKIAEDAMDFNKTSNLHILADVGFSFVTASSSYVPSSLAPVQILLPSSLYKANSKCLAQPTFDECFTKRIIGMFHSRISLEVESLNAMGIEVRKSVKQNMIVGCGLGRKRAFSQSDIGSTDAHEHCISYQNRSSKNLEPRLENEQLSFCDSATTSSSHIQSHNVGHKMDVNSEYEENNFIANNVPTSECSKYLKAELQRPCSFKEIHVEQGPPIGQRIKLFSPINQSFNYCTVDSYNSETNTHKITFDNGEVELLCLEKESWETITDSPLKERVSVVDRSKTRLQQHCVLKENSNLSNMLEPVYEYGHGATKEKLRLSNNPRSMVREAKLMKVKKGDTSSSLSEVIDIHLDGKCKKAKVVLSPGLADDMGKEMNSVSFRSEVKAEWTKLKAK